MMRVKFKVFRSSFSSWENLFQEAADFASSLAPEQLINISSAFHGEGVVTVWYWGDDRDEGEVV